MWVRRLANAISDGDRIPRGGGRYLVDMHALLLLNSPMTFLKCGCCSHGVKC